MTEILIKNTTTFFREKFNTAPEIVVMSPGRINIIGEHIDYNDGFVLPAAINRFICFAFKKNNSLKANITAIDLNDSFEIDLNHDMELSETTWTNYLRGIINQLKINELNIAGFDCVFSSNIPVGSGLSSSAALECGFLFGINTIFNLNIKPLDISLMGQKAEHWVGINCGIMDQFSSVMGIENKVLKIDCKTLEFEYYPANFKDYSLILLDSAVKHSLFSSAYNTRRKECEEGLSIIKNIFPQINSFRDCAEKHLTQVKEQMTENVYKRCHFVVKEILRVSKACEALHLENIHDLGQLMFETHEGLSNDYEVSCAELDFLVTCAKSETAVIGARLMGGGFGGCTINLVKKGEEQNVIAKFSKLYFQKFGIELKNYDVEISNGTHLYSNN